MVTGVFIGRQQRRYRAALMGLDDDFNPRRLERYLALSFTATRSCRWSY
jgi:hypothetical protein